MALKIQTLPGRGNITAIKNDIYQLFWVHRGPTELGLSFINL